MAVMTSKEQGGHASSQKAMYERRDGILISNSANPRIALMHEEGVMGPVDRR